MLQRPRARFVETRTLADGTTAFYFCIPKYYRKLGCEIANEPLGTSYEAACGEDGKGGRAATLNALFDEWNDQRKGEPIEQVKIARYGTIDWLFRQYKTEKAYTEKVSPRSRPDYERIMQMICDTVGKSGLRIGARQILEVTPRAADRIYERIISGPNGLRLRQGEKVVGLCRKVWRIMRRLHPELFDKKHPNPWDDFTLKSRTKGKKHAVTREEVYKFAWGCIAQGRPEPAAVAVICFEWLQRPENVVAGLLGRVDGFDQDDAEGERDEGTVIARSLLATKGDALEALEFADGLLDARPRFVEDFREESGSVGCSRAMRNDRTNAALAGAVAIGFGVVTFVGDGGARQNIGSDVEQEFEVAAVAGFAPGQMEGERQAVEVDLEVDFG